MTDSEHDERMARITERLRERPERCQQVESYLASLDWLDAQAAAYESALEELAANVPHNDT